MVGMHVGDDHTPDGQPTQRSGKKLLPRLRRLIILDPAVDRGPSAFVFKQPQIYVIELHRQAHANPKDSGPNLDGLADFRSRLEWIVEIASRTHRDFGRAH